MVSRLTLLSVTLCIFWATAFPSHARGDVGSVEPQPGDSEELFHPLPDAIGGLIKQDNPASDASPGPPVPTDSAVGTEHNGGLPLSVEGRATNEAAFRLQGAASLSKLRDRLLLTEKSQLTEDIQFRSTQRVSYDSVFDLNERYPSDVAHDEREELQLRDTYLDYSRGDIDVRVGKQQIVWGEALGLFFADSVNAKDLREFVLPDFDSIRIPAWALDISDTQGDLRGEFVWIPVPEMNKLGLPGSEFAPRLPAPPAITPVVATEERPSRSIANGLIGARLTYLVSGWNLSLLALKGPDRFPTYYSEVTGDGFILRPRHARATMAGFTLSQDFGQAVLRGEFVFSRGARLSTADPADSDGVIRRDLLDFIAGVDPRLDAFQLSLQFMGRAVMGSDPAEAGAGSRSRTFLSALIRPRDDGKRIRPELFLIEGTDRVDFVARPSVSLELAPNLHYLLGLDLFGGDREGMFGYYGPRSRINGELRYDF